MFDVPTPICYRMRLLPQEDKEAGAEDGAATQGTPGKEK